MCLKASGISALPTTIQIITWIVLLIYFLQILQNYSVDSLPLRHQLDFQFSSNSPAFLRGGGRVKRSGLFEPPNPSPVTIDFGSGGYKIVRKLLDWKEAHDYCERAIGHLAAFINETDADSAIVALHKLSAPYTEEYDKGTQKEEYGLDRRYWIGLSDFVEEGRWEWVGRGRGLNYTTKWYPGQPDHILQKTQGRHPRRLQHCVSLWNPGYFKSQKHSFDDLECDRKLYFICEEDSSKVTAIKDKLGQIGYVDNTPLP